MNDGQFVAGYHALSRLLAADATASCNMDRRYVALYGDLQPGNFLAVRAGPGAADWTLSGFLDYEGAAFRDLLLGLAKYLLRCKSTQSASTLGVSLTRILTDSVNIHHNHYDNCKFTIMC